jgi:hypothetical protein
VLAPSEQQAAVAEWQRLAAEKSPPERKPIGCLAMIAALVAAVAAPAVLGWAGLQLSTDGRSIMAALFALVFVAGLLVWLFSQGKYGRYVQRAEAAEAALIAGNADLKHAVALLFHAHCADGPSMSMTLKPAEVRDRLGATLPYVIAVEEALKAELKIHPVFTA